MGKKTGFRLRQGVPFSFTASLSSAGVHGVSESEGSLAVACSDGNVRLFDDKGQPVYKLLLVKGYAGKSHYLAHSPDGALLAVTCSQTLFVVEVSTGEVLASQRAETSDVSFSFCWAPDGESLIWLTDSAMHRWRWSHGSLERSPLPDRRWYAQRRWPRVADDRVFFGAANTHGGTAVLCFNWRSGAHLGTLGLQDGGQADVPRLQPHAKGVVAWQPGLDPVFWDGNAPVPTRERSAPRTEHAQCFPEGFLSHTQVGGSWTHALTLHDAAGGIQELRRAESFHLPSQQGPALWLDSSELSEKPYGHRLERVVLPA
jgi:hypothetical protein